MSRDAIHHLTESLSTWSDSKPFTMWETEMGGRGSLNTVSLVSKNEVRSGHSEKSIDFGLRQCLGSFQERSLRKRIKGMSGTPTSD